jgi:hypothetical protein
MNRRPDWQLCYVMMIDQTVHLIFSDQDPYYDKRPMIQPMKDIRVSAHWWAYTAEQDPSCIPESWIDRGLTVGRH